jgi:predicted nuclease of predicted toxin-antitoxin system
MSKIRLLLDEDVWPGLSAALREHGFDASHVYEAGRGGMSDAEQLAYASREERVLLTHNARDFVPLAVTYFFEERSHAGIILATQMEKGALVRHTLSLLNSLSANEIANTIRYLSDYK